MFAEAKEGNIRLIAVDIQEGMLLRGGEGRVTDVPSLNFKSSCLRIEEEFISLSVLYLYLRFSQLSLLWFQPIFMSFHLSYVAVSRPYFTLTGPCYWDSLYLLDKKVMAVYQ